MKYKNLLTNVWLLSLIPFILVLVFAPVDVRKYRMELLRTDILTPGQYMFYDDLDNDGISERFSAFDMFNSSGISISNKEGIIDQWNFRGSFEFAKKNCLFISGDRDNDSKKEIYVFTISNDSILLHCISDLRNSSLSLKNRFIATTGKGIKKPDPAILPAEMDDLDNDGTKELIFGITSGFSERPRQIYAYYIKNDSLVVSPPASYFLLGITQADITGDGKKEILPWGYAASNIEPTEARYHDHSAYLIALDRNLEFIFEPVEFPGMFGHVSPVILQRDGEPYLSALYSPASPIINSTIFTISNNGQITDSTRLNFNSPYVDNCDEHILFTVPDVGVSIYTSQLKPIKSIPIKTESRIINDLDRCGESEYIFQDLEKGGLCVFRDGLVNPASLKLTIASSGWDILTFRTGYEKNPSISLQTGQNHYLIGYKKNTSHIYAYLYYPGVYMSILAFALLIRNVARSQLNKRYENEKKISELQMAMIRNQLDPHFTLNAINSIIYSVNYGDRYEAADSLRNFAGMYRDMVLSAGESRRSIAEEVEFCRNYLNLEKVRYGDRFRYKFDIDDDIDQTRLIPKFLIQIHSENAVKHGLSPKEEGGFLNVKIYGDGKVLVIEISDNGIGREQAKKQETQSTSKGLEIMKEFYTLYAKFYNENITSEIIDLYDDDGNSSGTSVIIRISSQG